jgi:hypothetical protein
MSTGPDRPWFSQRDRERLEELAVKRANYERLAHEATNDRSRRLYGKAARAVEKQIRYNRMYPRSIWLFGMATVTPMVPWAILGRAGHSILGLIAGTSVLAVEVAFAKRNKRRHADRRAAEQTRGVEAIDRT